MELSDESKETVKRLTKEEKTAMQTGVGSWKTFPVERLGIRSVVMSDGPHGLRKERDGATAPAVCFPTASKLACGFDLSVAEKVGAAIADECRKEDVDVILGPAVNIKRSALCGRNFEYFSEDPFLAGAMAAAYVKGVESRGVAACVKHFAANNQETARFVNDSVVDERALNEIYFAPFRTAVKNAKPKTVMCAYNKLNGEYCSENAFLLNDKLRGEWGFEGLVMTDWGAASDRPKGIKSGLDLQMPQGDTSDVEKALQDGSLTEEDLNVCAERILGLLKYAEQRTHADTDYEYLHALCRKVGAECSVLVKNSCNILPLVKNSEIAVIGALAEKPHFEGGGSSHVNAYKTESFLEALTCAGENFVYAPAYKLETTEPDAALEAEAVKTAADADLVVLVIGLTDITESEGYDRKSLALPENQRKVIDAVTSANGNVVVVVESGAPVDLSWFASAKAVLLDYMGGEAEGGALYDVLYGKVNPSGRLAETWPLDETYEPSAETFAKDSRVTCYKESIYVGYRYYDKAGVDVALPFGFGLSYTEFLYSDAKITEGKNTSKYPATVTVNVKNVGKCDGAEVVQVYVKELGGNCFKPVKELKGFAKVFLKKGETKTVTVQLDKDAFTHYNTDTGKFEIDSGVYEIQIARSVADVVTTLPFDMKQKGNFRDLSDKLPAYYSGNVKEVSDDEFVELYGKEIPVYKRTKKQPHTLNSTFGEIRDRRIGRIAVNKLKKLSGRIMTGKDEVNETAMEVLLSTPLRATLMASFVNREMLDGFLDMLNGRFFGGLNDLLKGYRKVKKKMKNNASQKKANS